MQLVLNAHFNIVEAAAKWIYFAAAFSLSKKLNERKKCIKSLVAEWDKEPESKCSAEHWQKAEAAFAASDGVAREGICPRNARTNERNAKKRAFELFEAMGIAEFSGVSPNGFDRVSTFPAAEVPLCNGPFCFLFRPNGKGRARAA